MNDNFSTDYVKEIDDDFHSMLILSSDSESENERDRNVFERWITLSSFLDKEKTYADVVKGKIILEIKDIDNASIITNDYNRQVIVSNKMVGLIMAMLSEEDDFLEILMDAIGSKGDTDYIDNNILNHDAGDILSVRADAFIEDLSTVYKSKHDLINKIYKATDGEFVIMGIYVEGKTILFTNGCKCGMSLGLPDLSDAILISGDKERINLSDDDNELTLRESDYLILARNTSKL